MPRSEVRSGRPAIVRQTSPISSLRLRSKTAPETQRSPVATLLPVGMVTGTTTGRLASEVQALLSRVYCLNSRTSERDAQASGALPERILATLEDRTDPFANVLLI